MRRNQKTQPVSARRKSMGDALFVKARKSRSVRLLLAKALLRREPLSPTVPRLAASELLATLRIASLAPTDLGHVYQPPRREWYHDVRGLALSSLTIRPLMPMDVKRARSAVRAFKPLLPPHVFNRACTDLERLATIYEKRIAPLKAALRDPLLHTAATTELAKLRRPIRPKRRAGTPVTPRGGRAISEHQQRVVATLMLLRRSGEKRPEEAVVGLLNELGIKKSLSKVLRAFETYDAASRSSTRNDAFISPEALPQFWLERLGWFFEHWIAVRRQVAPTPAKASLENLRLFVPEFLEAASPAVQCPPWRSPVSVGRHKSEFLAP